MTRTELLQVAAMLYRGLPVTTRTLRNHYGCSQAGAKRALRELQEGLPVTVETQGQRHVLRIHNQKAAHQRPVRSTTWVPW